MAKLSAHGTEIARYFDERRGLLISVRSDGWYLRKSVFAPDWKLWRRKKESLSQEEWLRTLHDRLSKLPEWARECRSLPSERELREWDQDGVCETPTGHRVEPDGVGPDGVPSWLRLLKVL